MSPPSGPPKDQTVSGQEPPAQGLPAAHGSLQAEEWGRKLNPAHPNQPSPWGLQAREGPRAGTIFMDGGLPGWAGLLVPTNLAAMVVEDKPVGGAQKGVSVSTPPQGFHGECLPQDHMMSHYVCILRGRRSSGAPGLSSALDSGIPPTASLCQGIRGSPSEPSPFPLGHPCPSDLTRLLLLPWASRERFVGTKMV